MSANRQQRERVMAWQIKLGTIIQEALPDDVGKAQPEIDALHVALLELGIGALLDHMDQTETMTFVNYVLYDMFDARNEPGHWRNKEAAQLAASYKKVRRQLDEHQR
jgi:hypothetical protein